MIRLIIVDDEETTRDSLMELVPWRDLGVDACRAAKNGVEALEIASGFPPSILLCDVKMPKMVGIELSKRIRVAYPDCAIVFLSGYSDKEYLKSAIKINAIDYLEKPVDLAELKQIFTNIVETLNRKSEEITAMDTLKGRIDENLPLIRQNFLKRLLTGNMPENLYENSLARDLFRPAPDHVFLVMAILINWRNSISLTDKTATTSRLRNALANLSQIGGEEAITAFPDDAHWVAVIRHNLTDPLPGQFPDAFMNLSLGDFSCSAGMSGL